MLFAVMLFFFAVNPHCEPDAVFPQAAWEIFTPLLHDIDAGKLKALPYEPGTRGPSEADELSKRMGYMQTLGYVWVPPTLAK
jgi:glucose-6-phosphate 1-dehydrogenase